MFNFKVKKRPYRENKFTIGRFLWSLYYAKKQNDALFNYVLENRNICEEVLIMPSKNLRRRYGLPPEEINGLVWSVMERYFNGELIEKPKDNENKPDSPQ